MDEKNFTPENEQDITVENAEVPIADEVSSDGEANANPEKKLKLDYGITFKVGFAFAIIMLFWTAYDFVVPLLLENAYGLPSWARGLIMGLDNLLSLFMLPVFGKLSDKANGKLAKKWGRRTPFIVIGTICAVVLMIFVPVVTLNQQRNAEAEIAAVEAKLNDDAFMEEELGKWYDAAKSGEKLYGESAANFCDISYLAQNKHVDDPATVGIDEAREYFTSLRFDDKMVSKKAILNFIGAVTYYYDGVEISDLNAEVSPGKTYQDIIDNNADYKKFVATGIGNYQSYLIHENHTTSQKGIASLAVYMVILLLVLVAMATFRSPAVALMPDVTPKPLRSQANAVINLCGGVGGAIAFLIYTIVLFGERLENYVIIFASVAAGMLLLLAGFLALVKERKLVARCQEICKEYGIDDFSDEETEETKLKAERLLEESEGIESGTLELDSKPDGEVTEIINDEAIEFVKGVVQNANAKRLSPKDWWNGKTDLEKGRLKSFWLILASIFMWFMGYNAISSNLSIYTTKGLNLSAGVASIISGVSMGVSAIAFIPVGYLAVKIGRRKSIMLGFMLAVISFVLICFAVAPNDNAIVPAALFAVFYLIAGFGLIIANVNTFPMVTELSTAETVGQYTGYYYMATMSAQAITPTFGGLIMDYVQDKYLFLYGAICVVIAIVLMCFVKHGDSKQIPTGKRLTKEEKRQIKLDTLENMD